MSEVVTRVAQQEPDLLSAVSSASAMWVVNAATVCPLRRFAGWPGAPDGGESAG
ncbi:N-succinylarginine dihydrolase [Klebsiella pneumoniae]